MATIFYMPPCWAWYLCWGHINFSNRDILGIFTIFYGCKPSILFFSIILPKYFSTVTKVPSSPGWHMNDDGHTYIFRTIFFGDKYNLGAGLYKIRLSSLVKDLWSRISVDSQWKWMNISEKSCQSDKWNSSFSVFWYIFHC